jgi:hypothetical protein
MPGISMGKWRNREQGSGNRGQPVLGSQLIPRLVPFLNDA